MWLPQFLLIGEAGDVDDVIAGIEKVSRHFEDLTKADPSLAGLKAMSRAERPRHQRARNY